MEPQHPRSSVRVSSSTEGGILPTYSVHTRSAGIRVGGGADIGGAGPGGGRGIGMPAIGGGIAPCIMCGGGCGG
eukprot:scaffold273448_cov23-Tisochrysis_lutea.AAC.2